MIKPQTLTQSVQCDLCVGDNVCKVSITVCTPCSINNVTKFSGQINPEISN